MEKWLEKYTNECYKDNTYKFHPYGTMIPLEKIKECVCFYPITDDNNKPFAFVVNWFNIEYFDANTWYRECSNINDSSNCFKHRIYSVKQAYNIYEKIIKYKEKLEKSK